MGIKITARTVVVERDMYMLPVRIRMVEIVPVIFAARERPSLFVTAFSIFARLFFSDIVTNPRRSTSM